MTLSLDQVKALLPHRAPMLLIDGAAAVEPGLRAEAFWCPGPDMGIFAGHFPGEPVLPGVYTVEAMAQTADLAALSLPRYRGKAPLLIGIDGVRLTRKIAPGDRLDLTAILVREREDKAMMTFRCAVSVGGEKAAEAVITLAMR